MERPSSAYNEAQPQLTVIHFDGVTQANAPLAVASFVAPKAMRILSVRVAPSADVAQDAANAWSLTLKTSDSVTTYATSNSGTGDEWLRDTPPLMALDATNRTVAEDACVHLALASAIGTPADLDAVNFAVCIEWTYA